ncbi:MAG: APC family permease [Solirubrobacterales bacterium]|nr:APC family permease [Solirubrobacterales bacterium]
MTETTSPAGLGGTPTGELPGAGQRLFVRRSSGLVREVSISNALFFNTAAFVGGGVGWVPVFYALAFVPVGLAGLSTYGWASVIVGGFCVLLAIIFASLVSVMPRSGGDYVFTTRLLPRIGPFVGWVESFTLVVASLSIVAFEVPIFLRNLQITGRIIGIGTGAGFFERANHWFASGGVITGGWGFLGALLMLAIVLVIVVQPTRRFHRIVSTLAVLGLVCVVLMFVFGLLLTSGSDVAANLPKYGGATVAELVKASHTNGTFGSGVSFAPLVFSFMLAVVLLNFIGFQYSAYIAGEVRGNISRSLLIAVLGALVVAVLMNSVYADVLARHWGFNAQVGWGAMYWSSDPHLPLGQPNSMPLVAAIATPGAWPLWAVVSLGVTLFPLLLCPVYLMFCSRIMLAWSLDRQVPEWLGRVDEKRHQPMNALYVALAICVLFALFQNFALLPHSIAPPDGKLNLVSTLWFSILMAFLTWFMPGINGLLARFTRRDLMANAPYKRILPYIAVVWLAFAGVLYYFAGFKPIVDALSSAKESTLNYFNRTGITFTIGAVVLAVLIFIVMRLRARQQGIDTAMMFREVPPD